jgi:hypothetical protein
MAVPPTKKDSEDFSAIGGHILYSCSVEKKKELHTNMCFRTLRLLITTISVSINMEIIYISDTSSNVFYRNFPIHTVHMQVFHKKSSKYPSFTDKQDASHLIRSNRTRKRRVLGNVFVRFLVSFSHKTRHLKYRRHLFRNTFCFYSSLPF